MPPHADGGGTGPPWPAEPGRPRGRARRSVHGGLRDLGWPDVSAGLRRRGRGRAAGWHRRLRGASRPDPASPRSPSGMRLHVGQTGGALFDVIDRHWATRSSGSSSNPGHQIHLDEWVNSPISRGSATELRSGMAFQVDVIPATGTPYHDEHRGRHRAGRRVAARGIRRGVSRRGRGSGAASVRDRDTRDPAAPRCAAVLEHPGLSPPFVLRPDRAMTVAG